MTVVFISFKFINTTTAYLHNASDVRLGFARSSKKQLQREKFVGRQMRW